MVVLVCTLVPLGLYAQGSCDVEILRVQTAPPKTPSCPPDTSGIPADATRAALACAWIEDSASGKDSVDHLLSALQLEVITPPSPKRNLDELTELNQASPDHDDLFASVFGLPDKYGRPTTNGLPKFLDTLITANTLPAAANPLNFRAALLNCTKDMIDDFYNSTEGKGPITRVYDEWFNQKAKYLGMYQLLDALWEGYDSRHLEKIRAAFDDDYYDDLKKQIGAKISKAK